MSCRVPLQQGRVDSDYLLRRFIVERKERGCLNPLTQVLLRTAVGLGDLGGSLRAERGPVTPQRSSPVSQLEQIIQAFLASRFVPNKEAPT